MSMTSTTKVAENYDNLSLQARYWAISGTNWLRSQVENYTSNDRRSVDLGNGHRITFSRVIQTPEQSITAKVLGTSNYNQSVETNYELNQTFESQVRGEISFNEDFNDFSVVVSDPNKNPITIDTVNKTFTIGNNEYNAFASFYYTGSKTLNFGENICTSGVCDFKSGFRFFFTFKVINNDADGITFVVLNPVTNTIASVGGDSDLGEMIGYAADGRVWDSTNTDRISKWVDPERNGIQPPKFGIEFDNYINSGTGNICGNGPTYGKPSVGQRADRGTTPTDHIAYVFWGGENRTSRTTGGVTSGFPCASNATSSSWRRTTGFTPNCVQNDALNPSPCPTYAGAQTYDDNRHSSGVGPSNSTPRIGNAPTQPTPRDASGQSIWMVQNNGTGASAVNYTWTSGSMYAFRGEVHRNQTANSTASGAFTGQHYDYNMYSWVRSCIDDTVCSDYVRGNNARFADTSRDLSIQKNPPLLKYQMQLNSSYHNRFNRMIFGWTEATGGATQLANYRNFTLTFRRTTDTVITDTIPER